MLRRETIPRVARETMATENVATKKLEEEKEWNHDSRQKQKAQAFSQLTALPAAKMSSLGDS